MIDSKNPKEYYKVLEVHEEASPEEIKKAYIKKVKEYPPEESPEEFKRVREAYDYLKDPERQFGIDQEFSQEIREIVDDAFEAMEEKEFERALELFLDVQRSYPEILHLYRFGLIPAKILDEEEMIEDQIQRMEANFPKDPLFSHYLKKAEIYNFVRMDQEALMAMKKAEEILDQENEKDEKDERKLDILYAKIYASQRDTDKMLEIINRLLPPLEDQTADDLPIIIDWINTIIEGERWSEKSKIKKRVKRLLSSISENEERQYIKILLMREYKEYYEVSRFQAAQLYIDLVFLIDRKSRLVQDARRELKDLVRLERDFKRMWNDENLFPPVIIEAYELYAHDFLPFEDPEEMREEHPEIEDLSHMDEEFAAGILRIKKKYPALYKYYKEEWDDLFEEKTEHLNREARRRLR